MNSTPCSDSLPSSGAPFLVASPDKECCSTVTIDFETRSRCDIRTHGALRYAKHPSTEVLCMAYQINDGGLVGLWTPDDPIPEDLAYYITNGALIEAHNYFFEYCIWECIMVPIFKWLLVAEKKWRCTAALAGRHNLPRSLEGACAALKLPIQKDKEGHSLMLKMCKPLRGGGWHEDPKDLERLYEYCKWDVKAQRNLADALPPLEPRELAIWQFTERLNRRGVMLDLDFAKRAVDIFDVLKREGQGRLAEITNGAVTTHGQGARIQKWCAEQGVILDNTQKTTIKAALGGTVPDNVRELLEIKQKLSKSASISKYQAMLDRADLEDSRLKDHVRYFAAGPGRWGGKGVQTQNLVRKVDLIAARRFMATARRLERPAAIRHLYPNASQELSSCVRPTFIASPGHTFVCADFASVEARIMAWFTNDPNLEIFRRGKDIYIEMASKIYERPITKADKEERALGKEAELACQYQLWWRTLLTRCWGKGIKIDPALALKTVKLYRDAHPLVKQFWYDLEQAFIGCILYGKPTEVSKLRFEKKGSNARMVLPSGRFIVYNNVSVKTKVRKPGKVKLMKQDLIQLGVTKDIVEKACEMFLDEQKAMKAKPRQVVCYWRENSTNWKWQETTTYGGKMSQNACEAIGGDLLAGASLRLDAEPEKYGHAVMTVHDELVMEQREGHEHLQEMIDEMCRELSWTEGLPLAGEGWIGKDYRK